MSDNEDDAQTDDGGRREEEWLRLVRLRSKSERIGGTGRPRHWTRVLVSTGIFFTFFGLWWLRYIWSVAGLYFIFSIGGVLLVFAPITLGVLLLISANRKTR